MEEARQVEVYGTRLVPSVIVKNLSPNRLYKQDNRSISRKWEYQIEGSVIFVFIIPKEFVKNNKHRLVVINSRRNIHHEYVFSYRGKRLHQILNTGWKNARLKLGLKHLRVHDLKHTYGSRLRAANVSFEYRQDLLGHKSNRITTDYSAAELQSLINASEKVCLDKNAKKTKFGIGKESCIGKVSHTKSTKATKKPQHN